jgi:hypothetical protein
MKMTFRYDDGTGIQTVTAGPMAIVGYETANKTKISRLTDGIGVVDMTDLAWRQLRLEGRTTLDLDAWRETLVDIDPIAAEDPT